VDILLIAKEDRFTLRITDNGGGFVRTAPSGSGMGLKIMKYRADMIGAKFEIAANEPRGTLVTVTG
jgi:signal transduction histidine kinase